MIGSSLLFGLPAIAAMVAAEPPAVDAGEPLPWHLTGSNTAAYEGIVVKGVGTSIMIRSKARLPTGFAAFITEVDAVEYRGKRIRLRAMVSSDGIDGPRAWAGLWLRVDRDGEMLVLDNMSQRPVRGTRAAHPRDVVLDVAEDADSIAYGVLLTGLGTFSADNITLDVVASDGPVRTELDRSTAQAATKSEGRAAANGEPAAATPRPVDPAVMQTVASGLSLNAAGMFLFGAGSTLVFAPLVYRDGGPKTFGVGLALGGAVLGGIGAGLLVAASPRVKRPGFWLAKSGRHRQMSARAADAGWTPSTIDAGAEFEPRGGNGMLIGGLITISASAGAMGSAVVVIPVSKPAAVGLGVAGAGLLAAGVPLFVVGKRRLLSPRRGRAIVAPTALPSRGDALVPGVALLGRF